MIQLSRKGGMLVRTVNEVSKITGVSIRTLHYYDEIVFYEMYVGDERFKNNIDKAGGEGTAGFVKAAIAVYCAK